MSILISSVLQDRTQSIVFVHPDLSVSQCARLMAEHDIGALVVSDDENILGIVSERDIVRKCVCLGGDATTMTAADITHAEVTRLHMSDPIDRAVKAMTQTRRRHVLIINDEEELLAILSIGDVLSVQLGACSATVEHLEQYIHG